MKKSEAGKAMVIIDVEAPLCMKDRDYYTCLVGFVGCLDIVISKDVQEADIMPLTDNGQPIGLGVPVGYSVSRLFENRITLCTSPAGSDDVVKLTLVPAVWE